MNFIEHHKEKFKVLLLLFAAGFICLSIVFLWNSQIILKTKHPGILVIPAICILLGPVTLLLYLALIAVLYPLGFLQAMLPIVFVLALGGAWMLERGILAPIRAPESPQKAWIGAIACTILWYLSGVIIVLYYGIPGALFSCH